MARILVNYTYNKSKDEFKILESDCVYADMKIAVLETEEDIKRPLVVPIKDVLTVVDRDMYEKYHKKFRLISDDKGNISEDPNGAEIWLPKDTDISKLKYVQGRLVMLQEEKPKVAKASKATPKKANNKIESEA